MRASMVLNCQRTLTPRMLRASVQALTSTDKVFWFRGLEVRDYYSEAMTLLVAPIVLILYRLLVSRRLSLSRTAGRRRTVNVVLLYIYVFALLQITLSKAAMLFFAVLAAFLVVIWSRAIGQLLKTDRVRLLAPAGALLIALLPIYQVGEPLLVRTGLIRTSVPPAAPAASGASGAPAASAPPAAPKPMKAPMPTPDATTPLVSASTEEMSTLVRAQQSSALRADLTWMGRGLGATLSSGFRRDTDGYGFEQNYLNLLHKFGVFAVLVFLAYALMAARILDGLRRHRTRIFSLASLGFFLGLLMGYGNPILMSPVLVAFQCIALYWLRPAADQSNAA